MAVDEDALYGTKWFDYRMLKPDVATKVFLREYVRNIKRYFELLEGDDEGHINILINFDVDNYKDWKNWNTLEKLRQFADAHFMTYEDFWAWAFKGHLELKFRKIYPNVFLNERLKNYVIERSREYRIVKTSYLDFYKSSQYRGLALQDEYYWYLVREMKKARPCDWCERLNRMAEDGEISQLFLDRYLSKC